MAKRKWIQLTLTEPNNCADCGAELPPGTVVKRYPNGAIYGLKCHSQSPAMSRYREGEPRGLTMSRRDPRGVYTADGTRIGQTGPRCIDAPCCGCCD